MNLNLNLNNLELSYIELIHDHDHNADGTEMVHYWYRIHLMWSDVGPFMTMELTLQYDHLTWFLNENGFEYSSDEIRHVHQNVVVPK